MTDSQLQKEPLPLLLKLAIRCPARQVAVGVLHREPSEVALVVGVSADLSLPHAFCFCVYDVFWKFPKLKLLLFGKVLKFADFGY